MSNNNTSKRQLLQNLNFGQRVAEEEGDELANYFVETDQWRRIFSGAIDIVYGPKGSGKSALYSLLLKRSDELFDRGIIAISAENPRGAPVFKDLIDDPPASEQEFIGLWKLYFLSLIGKLLQEYDVKTDEARMVLGNLERAGLLRADMNLRTLLRRVREYLQSRVNVEAIDTKIELDPITGQPRAVGGRITLREPSEKEMIQGYVSANSLLEQANIALDSIHYEVWILLDRLDVAFTENQQLEENALRALFRVYIDFLGYENIGIKIFLRSDIWDRLTSQGFREASHITRHTTIEWDEPSLLNLVVRRILQNTALCDYYDLDPVTVLQSTEKQTEFFYQIFPTQVDVGRNKLETFRWMVSRTKDGTGDAAPRELIHLCNACREVQLRHLERGDSEPEGMLLFSRVSLKEGLPEVSRVRLEQTLYAEYPSLKENLQLLDRQRTQQEIRTLANIWSLSDAEALIIANKLVEIGFFERRGSNDNPIFWIPFLYRDALSLIQGAERLR